MKTEDIKERRDFLRKERKKRKLSQKQVADYLDIDRSFYSLIENNYRNPSHKLAVKMADFFGVDHKKFLS